MGLGPYRDGPTGLPETAFARACRRLGEEGFAERGREVLLMFEYLGLSADRIENVGPMKPRVVELLRRVLGPKPLSSTMHGARITEARLAPEGERGVVLKYAGGRRSVYVWLTAGVEGVVRAQEDEQMGALVALTMSSAKEAAEWLGAPEHPW